MKKILFLLCALMGLGCSSIQVHHDYERGVDWSAYRTYNFYPDLRQASASSMRAASPMHLTRCCAKRDTSKPKKPICC